ncbi:MAG: hypothetical protein RBR67_05050 [Desulfobacterium sp.]|jgi:hypothetical protein|nr:hypothetical protein [Desulfobacterium sp.]
MKRFVILSAFLCLWFFGVFQERSYAADPDDLSKIKTRLSTAVRLSDLLNYAYQSNPTITASKESWKIFIESYRIEKTYPDPQLITTFFPSPIETRLGPRIGT